MPLQSTQDDLDFDWQVPGALGGDYLKRLQRLQKDAPIFWSRYQNAWVVTRHQDIVDGLRDLRLSNSRFHLPLEHYARTNGLPDGPLLGAVRNWVFNIDGPDHGRLRRLLMKPFGRSEIQKYQGVTKGLFERILSSAEGRPQVEFVHEIALPYAAGALAHIIGLDEAVDARQMMDWSQAIGTVFGTGNANAQTLAVADRAIAELTPLLEREIAERRRKPRNDLMTAFVQISEDGDQLNEREIVELFHVLLLAAFETTANTLTLSVAALDGSAARRDYVRAHPDRMTQIVEELQRQVGMLNMMHRICAEDFEWHGSKLKRGDMVYFMLSAGNWDETVYPKPEEIDFDRERKIPLMFAPGLHHCIGHNLAKMELEIAISTLFDRYERVRVLTEEPRFAVNFINRSFETLDVRFESRR
jgi:pimeloyl-[acyl-carrier protein] synthase